MARSARAQAQDPCDLLAQTRLLVTTDPGSFFGTFSCQIITDIPFHTPVDSADFASKTAEEVTGATDDSVKDVGRSRHCHRRHNRPPISEANIKLARSDDDPDFDRGRRSSIEPGTNLALFPPTILKLSLLCLFLVSKLAPESGTRERFGSAFFSSPHFGL